jgi:hypothetical protein
MEEMMQAILAVDNDHEISICPMLLESGKYYEVEIYKWSRISGNIESSSIASAIEPTIEKSVTKIYNVLKDEGKIL